MAKVCRSASLKKYFLYLQITQDDLWGEILTHFSEGGFTSRVGDPFLSGCWDFCGLNESSFPASSH